MAGGIHIDITGDNSNIVSVIQDTTARMEQMAGDMHNLSQSFDFSDTEEAVKALNKAIEGNEEVLKGYSDQLTELAQKQEEAAAAGDVEKVKEYGDQMSALAEQIKDVSTETEQLRGHLAELTAEEEKGEGVMIKLLGGTENYKKIIAGLPGPLKNAVTGLNQMTGAAKAFIATPLGAILAALILAYKAITTWLSKTSEGQEKLAKITGYLSGLMAGLQQVVFNVGKALYNAFTNPLEALKNFGNSIKQFVIDRFKSIIQASKTLTQALGALVKLDFKGAGELFGQAFDEFKEGSILDKVEDTVEGIHAIGKAESDLNVRRDKLRRERMAWEKEEGELDKQIAEQRNKLYVGTQAERNAASAKMMELINQKYDKQIEFAKEEYKIMEASNGLTDSSLEQLEAQAHLEKQVLEIEAQRESAKRMALRVENSSNQAALRMSEQALEFEEKRQDLEKSFADSEADLEAERQALKLSSMKDGFAKERAEMRHEHEVRSAEIERQYRDRLEQLEDFQKKQYKATHGGSTAGFVFNTQDELVLKANDLHNAATENEQLRYENETAKLEKQILDSRNANRWAYLEKYGDYREKELAITEKYDKAIEDEEDEFAKKTLGKEKEQALYELQRQYSDAFSFIFADAKSLTDTQLSRAIELTQEAIDKAASDGNIEALSELYNRLRNQLSVQSDRSRKWGFSGLIDSLGKRKLADLWDLEADNLAEQGEEEFREEIQKYREDARQLREDLERGITDSISEIASAFSQLGSIMGQFEGMFDGIGDEIANIGSLFSSIASEAGNLQTIFSKTATESDKISAGISGALSLVSMIASAIINNKKAQDAWNKSIEASEQKMRMLKLEALDYKQRNIFGVENPYKKAIDGALQYSSAMSELQKMQAKLAGGKVQTGTRKAIDWGNVGKGAAAGAAAGVALGGGVLSWATAGIGAAVGAVAGLLSTKVVPVFEDLTSKYGKLWDDQYNLSDELLANYDKLDDETKQIVDNWEEIKDKALEAEQAMKDTFSQIAGDLGTSLSDSLAEAFKNGKLNSAIDSFHDKVSDTIESLIEQMVFSAVFGDMFDDLQKSFEASFGAGGDQNLVDDLMAFTDIWQEGIQAYDEQMTAAREYMRSAGYDILNNKSQRQAATRSSLGASQESIDESNGRLTAIQGHTYEINENVRKLTQAMLMGAGTASNGAYSAGIGLDYSQDIAEIRNALARAEVQFATIGATLEDLQSGMLAVAQSTQQIEGSSRSTNELTVRMKSDISTIVDKGVNML
ncbi:MAG: hypothetical protein J5658_03800 [Prevotella sp.]|nr:hypothetical protein [Prevotella sp.]